MELLFIISIVAIIAVWIIEWQRLYEIWILLRQIYKPTKQHIMKKHYDIISAVSVTHLAAAVDDYLEQYKDWTIKGKVWYSQNYYHQVVINKQLKTRV